MFLVSTFICIFYDLIIISCLKSSLEMNGDIKKNVNVWSVRVESTDKVSFFFFCPHFFLLKFLEFKLHLSIAYEHFRKKLSKAYTEVQTIIF